MYKRNEIVTNGCPGKCCEGFTFQYSIAELDNMIRLCKQGEKTFINPRDNKSYDLPPLDQMEKIRSMIIFVRETETCPQTGKNYLADMEEKFKTVMATSGLTIRQLLEHFKPEYFSFAGGKLFTNVYTCKHYDTSTKMCTDYDNRPDMCRAHGTGCQYKGCAFK